jgi:putative acetyltransferase
VIREYRDSDQDAVIEVWFSASQVAMPFLSETFLMEERDKLRLVWLPIAETWVFEIVGTVAGFISLLGNEVGAIFVHPSVQGRGIGRALMDHAFALRDSLILDVFRENLVGRRFYDSYGFRVDHEHVHERTGHVQMRLVYAPDETAAG